MPSGSRAWRVVVAALVLRDRGEEAEADGPRPVLTKPREAAGYTLDRSDAARRYSRTAEKDLESQAPDGNALVGTYEDGEDTLIYVGFSFPVGSEQGDALDASPDDALTSYLASAGIEDTERFDPGPLGGSLRCGRVASGAEAQVACAWADRGTLGSLRFARRPAGGRSRRRGGAGDRRLPRRRGAVRLSAPDRKVAEVTRG